MSVQTSGGAALHWVSLGVTDGTVVLPLTDIGCPQGSGFMAAFGLTWILVLQLESAWVTLQRGVGGWWASQRRLDTSVM